MSRIATSNHRRRCRAAMPGCCDRPTTNDAQGTEQMINDFLPNDQWQQLRLDFESAWRAALQGAPVPSLDTFLGTIAEPKRSVIRTELERIQQGFRLHYEALQRTEMGFETGGTQITQTNS